MVAVSMDDPDVWLSEIEKEDFATAITMVTARIYNLVDYKRNKKDAVSAPLCVTIKKLLDYVNRITLETYKKNIQLETRLEESTNYMAAIEALSNRLSRQSFGAQEDIQVPVITPQQKYRQDFPVIITVDNESEDMEEIKKYVKEACRADADLPSPRDVVITKAHQVILKMKNKDETEQIRTALMGSATLKERVKINVPKKRRERILILSVDPEIQEDTVNKTLRKLLDDSAPDGQVVKNLANRLRDATLSPEAKSALQDLYSDTTIDFEIIRQIKTRNGKINWLVDTDITGKEILLEKRRICIEFERYRVVEFLPITRCFKCQQFNHYAGSCKNRVQCVKCAEEHGIKDCKSSVVCCANCYFADATGDTAHRADSPDCPIYKDIRNKLIPNRS